MFICVYITHNVYLTLYSFFSLSLYIYIYICIYAYISLSLYIYTHIHMQLKYITLPTCKYVRARAWVLQPSHAKRPRVTTELLCCDLANILFLFIFLLLVFVFISFRISFYSIFVNLWYYYLCVYVSLLNIILSFYI